MIRKISGETNSPAILILTDKMLTVKQQKKKTDIIDTLGAIIRHNESRNYFESFQKIGKEQEN